MLSRHKICILGGGSFGTAMSIMLSKTVLSKSHLFHPEISLWIHQEKYDQRCLVDIINKDRHNPKYLPGHTLPSIIHSSTNMVLMLLVLCLIVLFVATAMAGCSIVFFAVPSPFLSDVITNFAKTVAQLKSIGNLSDLICVSLVKGIEFSTDFRRIIFCSERIANNLSIIKNLQKTKIHMYVLMGPNLAQDMAHGKYMESTLGHYNNENVASKQILFELLNSVSFRVKMSSDRDSVEICGALKNIIALGVGFSEGMNSGASAKASIINRGAQEIGHFCTFHRHLKVNDAHSYIENFDLKNGSSSPDIDQYNLLINQPCGMADLIVSCESGRNKVGGFEFVRHVATQSDYNKSKQGKQMVLKEVTKHLISELNDEEINNLNYLECERIWIEIQNSISNGQILQGLSTCQNVQKYLVMQQLQFRFPLLTKIHAIAFLKHPPQILFA